MNAIFEFFFCPIHGVLRPELWVWIPVALTSAGMLVRRVVCGRK